MRYFVPDIRLSLPSEALSSNVERLGGLPWGLPASAWPKCSNCGRSQSLLAQFVHNDERLDLGRQGRVLFVFQCNDDPGMCNTWEGGSGANACFVMEPESLESKLSSLPPDNPDLEKAVIISGWMEREDDVPDDDRYRFFSEKDYLEIFDTIGENVSTGTRLGGVPSWVQSPNEAPKGDWKFVGQLDSTYSFYVAPESVDADVLEDKEEWEGRKYYSIGPNFGDGGIAYIFLRNTDGLPEGWFFWQCG